LRNFAARWNPSSGAERRPGARVSQAEIALKIRPIRPIFLQITMARILVIDDEEPIRTVLRRTLTSLGHAVTEAADGKEGLRKFAEHGADLVITDLVMPETEGFEVLMTLRGEHPEVKVIAISGGGRQGVGDNLKMAKYLGASRVIQKPMSIAQLTEALDELLPASGTIEASAG